MSQTPLPEEMPESPDDVRRALGLSDEPAPGLADVASQIRQDMRARQGPHRKRTVMQKLWPMTLAAAVGALLFMVLAPSPSAGPLHFAASGLAALAGLLCLLAAAVAPDQPAAGERVALGGVLAALCALVVEGVLAAQMPQLGFNAGLKCAMVSVVTGLLPMGLVLFAIKRSGLPVRPLHATAIVLAALSLSGASVWLHCSAQDFWHMMSGHVLLPTVVAGALAVLFFRWLNRAPRSSVP